MLIIFAIFCVWIALYIVVLKLAFKIIEADRKSDIKRSGAELDDYDLEKKLVALKVTAFFVLVPIGLMCLYFTL